VKLVVNNLGRITQGEIEVRPLTVFVGHNNTNKTWTAYALYALESFLSRAAFSSRPVQAPVALDPTFDAKIQNSVNELCASLSASSSGTSSAILSRDEVLGDSVDTWTLSLSPTHLIQMIGAVWSEDKLPVPLAKLIVDPHQIRPRFSRMEFRYEREARTLHYDLVRSESDNRESFHYTGTAPHDGNPRGRFARIIDEAVRRLVLVVFEHTVIFPAERKAMQLPPSPFWRTDHGPFPFMRTPEALVSPLFDHVAMLAYCEQVAAGFSQATVPDPRLASLAALLETHIVQGTLAFKWRNEAADHTTDPQKRGLPDNFILRLDNGLELNMQAAASLVRSLAGMDSYLKYLCAVEGVIVIDEPEMNAHPDAQLAITELLAILVNSGVRVALTTHSPYIVDHINNLVEASQAPIDAHKGIAERLTLRDERAFLNPDSVSIYQFTDSGRVIDLFDRETRVFDLATFSTTSNYVANLYADILDRKRPITAGLSSPDGL